MEESSDPSDPNCEMVMKTIHSTHYRCLTCRKAFRSEEGVKKHLVTVHAISDTLLENRYEAFVVAKRVTVPKEAAKEKEAADPSVDSTSIAGVSYKCSMCENIYQTFQGVKGHLISFHCVTRPVSSDLFKYIIKPPSERSIKASKKPSTQFVTPTLKNKVNEKINKTFTPPLIEKKEEVKRKQGVKRKIQEESSKGSKKQKIDYCKGLANVFSSGNIQMRSLNMWGNDKKKKQNEASHLNVAPEFRNAEEPGYQSQLYVSESTREPDKSQGDKFCNTNTGQQTFKSQDKSGQSLETFPALQTSNGESQNNLIQSQISLVNLQTKQSHNMQKGDKVKTQRRKKLCDDPECRLQGPCSETDCGVCRFCLNRNLKWVFK